MITYIIHILFFQTLFLAIYDLFLKKETFFQWNRAYLILTSVLAYIIPFVKINSISNYLQDDMNIEIPTVYLNDNTLYLNEIVIGKNITSLQFSTLEIIYITGITITTILFLVKVLQIISKIKTNKIIYKKDYNLVVLKQQTAAFSFFDYLFLGKSLFDKEHKHIIDHELIHIKQKHSLDLLFFEIQKIIFWMNPFSYLFQNRISSLHEYIADAKAIKEHPKKQFFENLLNQSFQIEKFSFVNQFYKKSLIKKRIIMATKSKSKEILKLKYLLVLPVILLMFGFTSIIAPKDTNNINGNSSDFFIKEEKSNSINNKKIKLLDSIKKEEINRIIETLIKEGKIDTSNKNDIKEKLKDISNLEIRYANDTIEKELIEDVPFSVIENVPVYPGCKGNNKELKKCMSDKITKLVSKNFNVDLAQGLDLKEGKHRITTQFKIDNNGNVTNIRVRAPHPNLKEEVIRIIKLLPKMKPGKQKGKAVNVRYNLPIVFNVEDDNIDTSKIKSTEIEEKETTEIIPFSVIEHVPEYPGCNGNNTELKKCMAKKISMHVAKKFNINLAQNLGLSAGKKRISVQFKINNDGYVSDVRARAPHPKLQEEAIRIIKLLPKMEPGKQDDKAVNVRYNLPIVFNVEDDKTNKNKFTNKENVAMISGHYKDIILNTEYLDNKIIQSHNGERLVDIVKFKLKIPGKPSLQINGNKFTKEAIKNLKESKAGDYMIVYDIKVKDSNKKTSLLEFRVNKSSDIITSLEGTINGNFGYLKSTKSELVSAVIGALDYDRDKHYKAKKFQIVLNQKIFNIDGDRMTDAVNKAISKLESDDIIKIQNIHIDNNKIQIEPIIIKIK